MSDAVVVVVISGAQHLAAIARAIAEPLASAGAVEQVYAAIGPVANSVVECITAPERGDDAQSPTA